MPARRLLRPFQFGFQCQFLLPALAAKGRVAFGNESARIRSSGRVVGVVSVKKTTAWVMRATARLEKGKGLDNQYKAMDQLNLFEGSDGSFFTVDGQSTNE